MKMKRIKNNFFININHPFYPSLCLIYGKLKKRSFILVENL